MFRTMLQQTLREPEEFQREEGTEPRGPGLVLIFSGERAQFLPFALREGASEIGRLELVSAAVPDDHVSRRHLAVKARDEALEIRDLGSTNGVFVNGTRLTAEVRVPLTAATIIRIGRSLFLVVADIGPFERMAARGPIHDGIVAGPALAALHRKIAALGAAGQALFIRGESGSGKEIAARVFHEAGPRRNGPLVAVNCATIPKDLAERLLFGAVRGAYSGAVADSQGYLQAARDGTLFLDEVAELDLSVQAKLLRAIESHEVVPLGSTRPQPVDFSLCSATLRDLREAVAVQAFRKDLYYRIGRPEVRLPPLRERLEEVPHLIDRVLRPAGLSGSCSLVEACLVRPWPGNIRELVAEVRAAGALATAEGTAVVDLKHLGEHAGCNLGSTAAAPARIEAPTPAESPSRPVSSDGNITPIPDRVPEQLVSMASTTLGLAHKTVLKLFPVPVLLSLNGQLTAGGATEGELATRLRTAGADALFELLSGQDFNQTAVAAALAISRTTLIKLMDDLGLPRATDLDAAKITDAVKKCAGDLNAAARLLRVSPGALKRQVTQLELQLDS